MDRDNPEGAKTTDALKQVINCYLAFSAVSVNKLLDIVTNEILGTTESSAQRCSDHTILLLNWQTTKEMFFFLLYFSTRPQLFLQFLLLKVFVLPTSIPFCSFCNPRHLSGKQVHLLSSVAGRKTLHLHIIIKMKVWENGPWFNVYLTWWKFYAEFVIYFSKICMLFLFFNGGVFSGRKTGLLSLLSFAAENFILFKIYKTYFIFFHHRFWMLHTLLR